MTNFVRKATAFLLATIMLFSLAIAAHGAEIVSLSDDSVFLKQSTNYTCTLVSALMLFRRGALINKNMNWDSFTESAYRRSSWWPGGLSWSLKAEGMTAASYKMNALGLKTGDLAARREWFIDTLAKHPEGITVYCRFSANNAHAVLLTDYNADTDTFYCADPSPVIAHGRIPLSESELPSHIRRAGISSSGMTTQDYVLSNIHQIWIIERGIDYSGVTDTTVEMTEEELAETWITNTEGTTLRLRSGPSTEHMRLGKIPHGTTLTVTKKYNGWGRVEYDGATGWIFLEHAVQVIDDRIIMAVDSFDATVFGEQVQTDAAPIISNDRTVLPVRFISEALGASIAWDEAEQKITVTSGDTVITVYIGSDTAYIGDAAVTLDCTPFIQDGVSYAPVRFIAEALGAKVEWDATSKQITITR